jgi:hypothetical protein
MNGPSFPSDNAVAKFLTGRRDPDRDFEGSQGSLDSALTKVKGDKT